MKTKRAWNSTGYQLIDSEIAGLTGIALQPGQTQTVYKRFIFNAAEDMRYLVVKYYVGGQEYKAYFKLEEGEPPVNYERLASGSRGDAVQALQERLVELGYLDDKADGIFGGNTGNAIRAAQEQAGMESTGIARQRIPAIHLLFLGAARGLGGKGTKPKAIAFGPDR